MNLRNSIAHICMSVFVKLTNGTVKLDVKRRGQYYGRYGAPLVLLELEY